MIWSKIRNLRTRRKVFDRNFVNDKPVITNETPKQDIPERTDKEVRIGDICVDDNFRILYDILNSETPEILEKFDLNRLYNPKRKAKIQYESAEEIRKSFENKGVISCRCSSTPAKMVVINSFRRMITEVSSSPKRTSEVSFDIFREGDKVTYVGNFTAYLPIYLLERWFDLDIMKEAVNELGFTCDNEFFVLKVSFRLLFTLRIKENSNSSEDDLGIKQTIVDTANAVIISILEEDDTLQKIRFNIHEYVCRSNFGASIFDIPKDYKNSYKERITWEKEQYTNFNPMANIISIDNYGVGESSAITGDIDFSDDITQLLCNI